MPQCQHVKSDGSRCRANPQREAVFCFFHDPEKEAERAEASRSGGRVSTPKVLPDSPKVAVNTSSAVCKLLGETLNQVRRGALDPKVSNAIGYLANIQLKALEQAEIEDALIEIVSAIRQQPRTFGGDDLTNVSHLVEG